MQGKNYALLCDKSINLFFCVSLISVVKIFTGMAKMF